MGTAKALASSLLVLLLTVSPSMLARAESIPSPRVLISEIQTESSTDANQEFVELINVSGDAVDLSGWVVQYRAASGTSWADKALLSGLLYPNGSIVVSTQGYLLDVSSFFWTQAGGVLAATGGNVRLLPANSITPEDIVAWGTGIYGETVAASKAPKGSSINRKSVAGLFQDTNNNSQDFETLTPSPRYINVAPAVVEPPTPVVPEIVPVVGPILPVLIPDPLPTPDPLSETPVATDPEPVAQVPAQNDQSTPPIPPSLETLPNTPPVEVPAEVLPTNEVPDTPAITPDVTPDPVLATPAQPPRDHK